MAVAADMPLVCTWWGQMRGQACWCDCLTSCWWEETEGNRIRRCLSPGSRKSHPIIPDKQACAACKCVYPYRYTYMNVYVDLSGRENSQTSTCALASSKCASLSCRTGDVASLDSTCLLSQIESGSWTWIVSMRLAKSYACSLTSLVALGIVVC